MGKIVKLKNKKTGVKVYPVTATKAVVDADSGERLNDTLKNKVEEAPVDGNQYVRINGTWGIAQMATSTKEKCIITLASNQGEGDAASLHGAVIKVTNVDSDEVYHNAAWNGSEVSLEIAPGVNYKIEVSDVENYATPESKTLTALDFNVRNFVFTYNTELVSVMLSSDNGASMAGQKVTINGIEKSFDGSNAVTQKVAYGTEYTVSVDSLDGYNTPQEQSFTSEKPYRDLSLVYYHKVGTKIPSPGIYIQDIDGYFLTADEYSNSNGIVVNGIAVITDTHSLIVAHNYPDRNKTIQHSRYELVIDGIVTTEDEAIAATDFAGYSNTQKLLSSGSPGFTYSYDYCYNFIFPNGNRGYLGAGGEWMLVLNNIDAIDSLIELCGGVPLKPTTGGQWYWTSTQKGENSAWAAWPSMKMLTPYDKISSVDVVPFTTL